jgi:hypothetical protein
VGAVGIQGAGLTSTNRMVTLIDMAKPQIPFKEIPYKEVPFREPRTTVSGTEGKSQWDDALEVIKKGAGNLEWKKKPTRAIRMDGRDAEERKALKAKLQTMGRKRGCVVEVLDDGQSVYAWATERGSSDRCFR